MAHVSEPPNAFQRTNVALDSSLRGDAKSGLFSLSDNGDNVMPRNTRLVDRMGPSGTTSVAAARLYIPRRRNKGPGGHSHS